MKKWIITGALLLAGGFVFSQTTTTDTTKTKTTTTQQSTKLVKRKVSVVSVKKVDELKQKNSSKPTGKKEEEGTQPK